MAEEEEIWSRSEIRKEIRRIAHITLSAHRCHVFQELDTIRKHLKDAADGYKEGDLTKAQMSIFQARSTLLTSVNEHWKGWAGQLKRYWSFILPLYGGKQIFYGLATLVVSLWLLISVEALTLASPLNIPSWALLAGALGASTQILISTAGDIRDHGYVARHQRVWYLTLPPIGIVFGLVAFILFKLGLPSLDVSADSNIYLPFLLSFLAGYATDSFMERLSRLAKS